MLAGTNNYIFLAELSLLRGGISMPGVILGTWPLAARNHATVWSSVFVQGFGRCKFCHSHSHRAYLV